MSVMRIVPSGWSGYRCKGKNGYVSYDKSRIVGCCGVDVIFSVSFQVAKGKQRRYLYKDFVDTLLGSEIISNVNKIILTDRVYTAAEMRKKNHQSIYQCLINAGPGIEVGEEVFNPSSGNRIVVFEITRKVFTTIRRY